METKFYRCNVCGNIITKLADSGVPVECCTEVMEELVPQTEEKDGKEKHLPVCLWEDDGSLKVKVGEVAHPMAVNHYIKWIYLDLEDGGYWRFLHPGDEPEVVFDLNGVRSLSVYVYCNVHGLWKTSFPGEKKHVHSWF